MYKRQYTERIESSGNKIPILALVDIIMWWLYIGCEKQKQRVVVEFANDVTTIKYVGLELLSYALVLFPYY